MAYWDVTNGDLKIARCRNSLCIGISGFLSIEAPDTAGVVGAFASVVLDANEYPVVAYHDSSNGDLKVMHCNDVECSGGDESITSPDTGGTVGQFTSITLDGAGNPVIAYRDVTNTALKVLHCDDPNCAGVETPTTPDPGGDVGSYTSIVLDGAGNPVVGYYDQGNFRLKVLHCDDPDCAGVEAPVTADDSVSVGSFASLRLDSTGNPVVSYRDAANEDLLLLRCTTADCSGSQTPQLIDETGTTGWYTSLRLVDDQAVIAYRDESNGELRVYRERPTPAACNGLAITVDIGAGDTPTAGDDVILGTDSGETINGLGGNDTICALGGADTVFAGDGDDWVDAGSGNDTVLGQADNDSLNGGGGADMLSGNAGNDVINGDGDGDTAFGGSGDDTIAGGVGNDTLGGSSGTDTIRGEAGEDTISGGSDDDGLISGGSDNDAVNGGGDDDNNVHGDEGNDSVSGNGGKDVVYGDDGNDTVRGGQNDETVFGGPGDDFVSGNTGVDTCDGGTDDETAGDTAASNCETVLNVP
ncbi:MAG: calcium-binding protein [Actinomycetota bacterium]